MKRIGNLFETLISDKNLGSAIDEVNKTHHWKAGHKPNASTAWVEETKPIRIKELRRIIVDGFIPKPPRIIERYDASARKTRTISEPKQWPDQYVHHALIQVLQPVMMRGMDMYCCGSIKGRGAHYCKRAIEGWFRKDRKGTRYELCADIYHFYDSLDPSVVMDRMNRLIKDDTILDLIQRVIKDGVKIGAFPSQWFANTVLQPLDVLIRQSGLCRHYTRYMDNLTIFGSNKRNLRKLKNLIDEWLQDHGLRLKGDWQIFETGSDKNPKGRLPDAVGYRYGRDYTLPRKHNLLRVKRAIGKYRKRLKEKKKISVSMAASILSRLGQLTHCNNVRIFKKLFRGERLMRNLKDLIRTREEFTWSMYLEQRRALRQSRQREALIAT